MTTKPKRAKIRLNYRDAYDPMCWYKHCILQRQYIAAATCMACDERVIGEENVVNHVCSTRARRKKQRKGATNV